MYLKALLLLCYLLVAATEQEPEPYHGYDVVLKLQKKGKRYVLDVYSSSNYTWIKTKTKCFVIVIHGEFKKGKTFLSNLLFGINLPSEKGLSTIGNSIVKQKMDGVDTYIVDTEGGNEVRSSKEQYPLEKLHDEMAWRYEGEHILVLGELSSSNEDKIQNAVLTCKGKRIFVVYNLMHKNDFGDYLAAFATIGGQASTIVDGEYDKQKIEILFVKREMSRAFFGSDVELFIYVLLDNNSSFGKYVNGITTKEIKSQIAKTSKPVMFEPVLSSLEAVRDSIIHNSNVDDAAFQKEEKALKPKILEVEHLKVIQKDEGLLDLIGRFTGFNYFLNKLKPVGNVKDHSRVGRINIIGGSKEKEEEVIVSSTSLAYSISTSPTTVLIKIDCPGFVYGKTLKVSPLPHHDGGVKVELFNNEQNTTEEADMVEIYSKIQRLYGKKLFLANNNGELAYTYCHDMTLYENGRLYLYWRVDGIPCGKLLPKKDSPINVQPDPDPFDIF